MPSITDWLMVAITVVYVIATIIICVFNGKAAKAANKQTAEMQRQFYETNRPNITVEVVSINHSIWALRFTNIGTLTAYNVKILLDDKFQAFLPEGKLKDIVIADGKKVRTIAPGKSSDLYLTTDNIIKAPDAVPIRGQVIYNGARSSIYADNFEIDMANYATMLSVDSEMELLLKRIDAQNSILKDMQRELANLRKGH